MRHIHVAIACAAALALAGCDNSSADNNATDVYRSLDSRCVENVSQVESEVAWAAKQTDESAPTIAKYIGEVMKDQNRTGVSCGAYVEAYVIMRKN